MWHILLRTLNSRKQQKIILMKKMPKNYANKKLSFDFSLELKVTQILCFDLGFRDVGIRIGWDIFCYEINI